MMDKKRFISVILITTAMLFAGGCGKQAEPVTAEPTPSHTVDPEESMESSEATDNSEKEANAGMLSESKPVAQASSDSASGSSSNNEFSTEDTDNSQASAEPAKPAETKQPEQTEKPAQTTQTEKPAQTVPAPDPKPEPAPVHEHTWKEHTATKQTWIPNIVVVDDYETQTIESYVFICGCDFQTTDRDVISAHFKECFRAGNTSNFTIQDHSYTEQVKVGSHEEDQGHYETSTYIDYYYCDCGATK